MPLGSNLDNLFGDFIVVCQSVTTKKPACYVLTPEEVRRLVHKGEKDGKTSFWLQPKHYEKTEFHENWDRIGSGSNA